MGIDPVSLLAISGIASAVAGIGGTVYSAMNKPKKPDTPMPSDRSAKEAAYAEAERMRKKRAMGTLVTEPGAALGEPSTLKTQLGA